eukprot:gene6334-11766_t
MKENNYSLKAVHEIERPFGGKPIASVLRTNFLKAGVYSEDPYQQFKIHSYKGAIAQGERKVVKVKYPVDKTTVPKLMIPSPHFGRFFPTPGRLGTKQDYTDNFSWFLPPIKKIEEKDFSCKPLVPSHFEKHRVINRHKEARINEERSRSYQETYANKRRKARKSNLQVGDTVLVRQQKRDKLTTRFSKTQYKVVNRKGTQITAEDSYHRRVTRNVSFFKKLRAQMSDSEDANQSNRATYACEQEVPRPAERLVRKRYAPVRYGEPIPLDTL